MEINTKNKIHLIILVFLLLTWIGSWSCLFIVYVIPSNKATEYQVKVLNAADDISLVSEVGGNRPFKVNRITIDGNNYLVARSFHGISIIPETKK